MEPARFIDDVNARLSELFAASPMQDIERNVKALVASALERLELATREEFDVQARVLARTREKLERLEARVAELEQQLKSGD
jgi:BMFP domain-containing protein YqiC